MSKIAITHTCGHVVEHVAYGSRAQWLSTKPCPACAGVQSQPAVERKPRKSKAFTDEQMWQIVEEVMQGFPEPSLRPNTEYQFVVTRNFRFDFAWPAYLIAVEVEGFGRHMFPGGFSRDIEKYNLAGLNGWLVLRTLRRPADFRLVLQHVAAKVTMRDPIPGCWHDFCS